MILHLSQCGSKPIELHIRDSATLFINPAAPTQKTQTTNAVGSLGPAPRLVALALAGGLSRVADLTPTRIPRLPPPALAPLPIMPGSIARSLPRLDEPPQLEATSADIPATVTRQLAEQPIVIPAPAQPRTGAGGSAFGLEN
jgi:hypothetical protein